MVRQTAGFTLVESLIALIVVSIGLLGIAALYVETLRFGRSAQNHTQAAYVAADLADRMRANRVPVDGYAGTGTGARAIADLAEWRALVAARLPRGAGEVRFVPGTTDTPAAYTIRVSWHEIGGSAPLIYELRLEI
jgi:type IV pilus assembly protein PilV